jgi:hypothetical protein
VSIDPGARRDWGFFGGGGDPGDGGDGPEPECEFAGHTYLAMGGGLETCANCGADRWADEEEEPS